MRSAPLEPFKSVIWTNEKEVMYAWDGYDAKNCFENYIEDRPELKNERMSDDIYHAIADHLCNSDRLGDAIWEAMNDAIEYYYENKPDSE